MSNREILLNIILFILSFVFISIWSYKLGYTNLYNIIFNCEKMITEYTDDSCKSMSFLGIVYDKNSPTFKQLNKSHNPYNIDYNKLEELQLKLNEYKESNEKIDDFDFGYISGQLNIIDNILKK